MPKFYVTCASQTLLIEAATARQAAMRLMDEIMGVHIWIYDDNGLTETQRRDHLVLEALLHLSSTVSVSEQGFQKNEAGLFGVPELLDEWHRLMTSIARVMVAAGLDGKRALPSSSQPPTIKHPR